VRAIAARPGDDGLGRAMVALTPGNETATPLRAQQQPGRTSHRCRTAFDPACDVGACDAQPPSDAARRWKRGGDGRYRVRSETVLTVTASRPAADGLPLATVMRGTSDQVIVRKL
jgi:hypothetical protein